VEVRAGVAAPKSLGKQGVAEAARPLDRPRDVRLGPAEHAFGTLLRRTRCMAVGQVRSLVSGIRDERGPTVGVRGALARSVRRAGRSRIFRVPRGGEFSLIAPQGTCEHAMVLLRLSIGCRVSDERTHVVEGDAVPFVHLGLGGISIVGERVMLVEHLPNTTNAVNTRANRLRKLLLGHLRGVVHRTVPFGRLPISRADPAHSVGIVSSVGPTLERLGGERRPVGLVWGVLLLCHHYSDQ